MSTLLNSPVLVALATSVLGLLGVYITHRFARGAQRETDMQARVKNLEDDGRMLIDYVHKLRTHIAEEKGPPPPPWPEGLTR